MVVMVPDMSAGTSSPNRDVTFHSSVPGATTKAIVIDINAIILFFVRMTGFMII